MKGILWLMAVLATAVLASGLGVVYNQHLNRRLFVEWQKHQVERDALEVEWESLQLEKSTLMTDAAVEATARARLNMIVPDPGAILYIAPR